MVADLPAKAAVLNCNQFNDRYGCTNCEIEGKVVKKGRGHTRVYSFTGHSPALRSHRSVFSQARTAVDAGNVSLGDMPAY